jgi:hypothetical protein
MFKSSLFLILILFASSKSFAADTVKVIIATQVLQCTLGEKLNCKALGQIQSKEIVLKKEGGNVELVDKEHGLSAEIVTSLENNNVVYSMTLCSSETCSISTTNTDQKGNINQSMSGQYNYTQKSFYILLFFITNQVSGLNLEELFTKMIP